MGASVREPKDSNTPLCYTAEMTKRVPEHRTARARALRTNATPAERRLWRLIFRYRPAFTRQLVIGPYIADFACREARLVVELDGGQHCESAADVARDAYLSAEGWRVLRIWNNEFNASPEGAVDLIMSAAAENLGGTHPQPLPGREGRTRKPRTRIPLPAREG